MLAAAGVGAGQRLEPRDDLAAFSCAWEAVKEAGRDYERQQVHPVQCSPCGPLVRSDRLRTSEAVFG